MAVKKDVIPMNDYKIMEKGVGQPSRVGPLPRPMLRGRGTRKAFKIWVGSAVFACALSAPVVWFGNKMMHDKFRKFFWNFDVDARDARIAENCRVSYNKHEYFWRTGRWPGNGYIDVELPEGARTYEEFKKPLYKMMEAHPHVDVDKLQVVWMPPSSD